jgi:hypothetical protein
MEIDADVIDDDINFRIENRFLARLRRIHIV